MDKLKKINGMQKPKGFFENLKKDDSVNCVRDFKVSRMQNTLAKRRKKQTKS